MLVLWEYSLSLVALFPFGRSFFFGVGLGWRLEDEVSSVDG